MLLYKETTVHNEQLIGKHKYRVSVIKRLEGDINIDDINTQLTFISKKHKGCYQNYLQEGHMII